MENPFDYSKCSLEQLVDVKKHIDKEKYPETYTALLQEMGRREAQPQLAPHKVLYHPMRANFAIAFVLLIISYSIWSHFGALSFDSSVWKSSGTYEKQSVRRRMSGDLLASKKLIGMSHFQVVSFLGKPDQYGTKGVHNWDMAYVVGYSVIDPIALIIMFDSQKRVKECDVVVP